MMKHDEMHQTDVFLFLFFVFFRFHWSFFSVDVDVVCNCCQRCVPKIHSLCRSSSGRVQFTHWEVKGKWTPVSEIRGKNEEEEGKKEAHHIIILSWRPTKISGFKTCFSEIFFCLFCFSGGKKTNSVFHSSDVVFFFASFWRLRSDRHIAQSLFATIYVTWF